MGTRFTRSSARPTDAELFDRFVRGDDAAFEQLLERHNRRLYAYCLKMIGDAESAQDVMQGLWERVIRMRESGRHAHNPAGLFVRTLRNLSLNHKRDRHVHLSIDDLGEAEQPDTRIPEPSQLEELVVMALDRLPMAQREVIVLHTYSGYLYTEISTMLEIPVDTIRMRAMRGRAHLARIIAALMAVDDDRETNDKDHPIDSSTRKP